ncbi:MAG: alpha/beta hydrolase [Candidatus Dormibacteraeota bacterium]|nr:alpha/beta hydrolase [Candidatus Dormibacteraeota bacterium]
MTKLADRVVTSADGRKLQVAEWGAPNGTPVFNLHGTPGSRLGRDPDETLYERLDMHLVTYDRPGYGGSDRQRGRRVVDAVADVVSIADALGFDQFVVGGGSGGAPHALACGALLKDRVLCTFALVPVAPFEALGEREWMRGQAPANVREVAAALAGEEKLMEQLGADVEKMRTDALNVLDFDEDLHSSDRAVMAREDVQRVFREMLAEAISQGPVGWVDDDLAILSPWGFDVSSVRGPVVLAYGANDTLTPRAHGEYLARTIPGAEVRIMDTGHLAAMEHAEENWGRVLEIARPRR